MNSSGNPCILNASSFPAVCVAEYPITWPVSQFYSEVTSPASGLQALLKAPVTDITVYHRPGGPVTHDYLIMCIRSMEPGALGGLNRIWARCERNPGSIPGGAAKLYRGPAPALDTIRFSVDRPKLRAEGDNAIMECAYDALKVEHISDLLMIIHEVSPRYGLASYNCWWFAAVAIGTLQVLGSDWTIKPSRDWAKKAVQALGKSTRDGTHQVTVRFADRWHSGVLPTVSITNDLAWEGPSMGLPAGGLRLDPPPRNVPAREIRRGDLSHSNSAAPSVVAPISNPNRLRAERRPTYDSPSHETQDLLHSSPPDSPSLGTPDRSTPPPQYQAVAEEVPGLRGRLSSNISPNPARATPWHRNPSTSASSAMPAQSLLFSSGGNGLHGHISPGEPIALSNHAPQSSRSAETVPEDPDVSRPGVIDIHDMPSPGSPVSSQSRYSFSTLPGSTRSSRMNSYSSSYSVASLANVSVRGLQTSFAPEPSLQVPFDDGTTLDALVWRVLWSRDPKDLQVLLAIHPSFTSSSDLLRELKTVFRNTLATDERVQWIRPRILGVLDQWLSGEHFDHSLGSELQGFLTRDVKADPGFQDSPQVQSMLERLERMLSNIDELITPMSSISLQATAESPTNTNFRSKGGRRTLKADSVVKMKDKDLAELALSLEVMEIEMRRQLTLARIVRWLKWRRTPAAQSPTARPFSPLSDKIAAWVVDTCLQGSLDHRAQALSKFVTLAERCRENGNLASLSDLLYGLRSPAIERLHETRLLSRGTDSKLFELMQLINPRTSHHLFPLNPRMLAFVAPFNNTILESGLISWSRCHDLYGALVVAATVPSTLQLPQVHHSYTSFLTLHVQTASRNAPNHHAISQRISVQERGERVALERSAAGMRAR